LLLFSGGGRLRPPGFIQEFNCGDVFSMLYENYTSYQAGVATTLVQLRTMGRLAQHSTYNIATTSILLWSKLHDHHWSCVVAVDTAMRKKARTRKREDPKHIPQSFRTFFW
jgi:hypothetical protein